MTALTEARRCAWDTETTGTDPETARIVTAAVLFRGGGQPDHSFACLINPGVPIPDEAAEIHGVTTERAQADGQEPKVALDDIASRLADALTRSLPVIAFNQEYDYTVLDRELRRHDLPTMDERLNGHPPHSLVDPHVIDKALNYRKGPRKLKPTCEHYGIKLENWHTADADALAADRVTEALFTRYKWLARLTPGELFTRQQQWRERWARSFQAFLRDKERAGEKYNPDAVVDGSWPLRPWAGDA